jgi:ABC-type transport system involved in multi-copper enzyme maturation permease subunit
MRWGLGPVFVYECLANSRRWQTYAIRSIGVALLLAAIASIWLSHTRIASRQGWREYAELGESYFYAIIGVELTLVMLAAPAATAGAICVDRARGTLTHMLATDLSDPEIVLGKLAARLLPVLGLVACSWPVLALSSLLGGIDPTALTLAFAIIVAVALLGCTMALALSVWARKPHEVVLVVYTFWMLVLLLWPIWYALSMGTDVGRPPAWSLVADPYYLAFAPYSAPGRVGFWDYVGFFAAALGASAALAVLAVRRMRPVARRGNDDHRKEHRLGLLGRVSRWLPGPSLDGNPVLWREWHRSRPSRWLMILVVLVGGGTSIACIVGAVSAWLKGMDLGPSAPVGLIVGVYGYLIQLIFGLLMLSAVAPTSMSEERQRGSLDLLAATTLSTPTIVLGKWLGVLRLVALLVIGPGLVGIALATATKAPPPPLPAGVVPPPGYFQELSRAGQFLGAGLLVATIVVHGALLASVGLALATWIARQSRAIAMSVGFAVLVGAGWPILIGVSRMGPAGEGLMCLSPVVAGVGFVEIVDSRSRQFRELLWWIPFWDIECLVLALGLLWLTVRTFDGCFGRISDRPGRVSVLSDVVVVLAGLIGVGGLFGAVAIWIKGTWDFMPAAEVGVMACVFLVAVGFHLLAALAASSMSRGATVRAMAPGSAASSPGRRLFAIRWWESFRLVLLLAIGPALIALALATAPVSIRVVDKETKLAGGGTDRIYTDPSGNIYVVTTDATGKSRTIREATDAEIAAAEKVPQRRDRAGSLAMAALVVATILAHGAAFVSLGAALGVWIRRRGRAIAASVGLVLLVTVVWPIFHRVFFGDPAGPWRWTLASVLSAFSGLMFRIRRPLLVEAEITAWAGYWDVIMILAAVIASGLAIRTLDRRSRGSPGTAGPPDPDVGCPVGAGPEAPAEPVFLQSAEELIADRLQPSG